MEKTRAITLLENTFKKSFDESRFSEFIGEVFNKSVSAEEIIKINTTFKEHISSAKLINRYKLKREEVAIISVNLKKSGSRDLARTMQRNFVARYIENENIGQALVAFHDSSKDWRFSFVEVNYKLDSQGKPIKDITGAKRSSFLVGPNEPNHTCQKQFLPLLENLNNLSIEDLRSVFEIEKVTKEFFKKYEEHFHSLVDSIKNLVKKDKIIKEEFIKQDIDISDFVKKLMGQLVFLYFIQKKGWLGVDKTSKWGLGNKKFLINLLDECKSKGKDFFNDYLEYLFYNALAKDRRANKDYFPKFGCRIPFLNGGLFEPINNYDWEKTDIILGNDIFEKLFNFLNSYNFTIKEDEPLDREVAVDPEMLGKVFENLLEIKDRKSKGAFYTPREIVHYMCQQSILNYLETNTKIKRRDLEKFVLEGDNYLELTKLYESKKIEAESDWTLPKSIKQNYELLDKLLTDIKIVDPAVGSGAFPMGMMNELVKLRQILSIYFSENKQKTRTDYNLKRSTIENCIYGVDIMPSAIEICKLRFWLSLVVDEEGNKIEPLPNLENKLRIGNSLLEEFEGVKLFDERLLGGDTKTEYKQSTLNEILKYRIKKSEEKLRELKRLHKQFFNEEDNRSKNNLRNSIDRMEWELIEETLKEEGNSEAIAKLEELKKSKSKPFFLWKLYFAEVFQRENPGFDVVIANPPYGETIKENKETFKEKYYCTEGKYEIYKYFFEKGISLLRQKAVLVYITPDTWLTLGYFKKLREMIVCQNNLKLLTSPLYNVFEAATVDTIVSVIKKDLELKEDIVVLDFYKNKVIKKIKKSKCEKTEGNIINLKQTDSVIDKLDEIKLRINDFTEVWQGLIAYSSKNQPREYTSDKKETPEHRKLLFGSDIGKYYISWKKSQYLKYGSWLHRSRPSYIFDRNKILVQRIRNPKIKQRIIATIDKNKYINGTGLSNILILEEFEKKYFLEAILGIVNSKLINYWFSHHFHDVNIKPDQLRKIPIVDDKNIFLKLKELVDQILSITKDNDYLDNPDKKAKVKRLEKEIDQLVYKIYGLTKEEIKIVEGLHND